jgi:hypothetical protein
MIRNPYDAHTLGVAQIEKNLGSGNPLGMATLTFAALNGLTVPVTLTEVMGDWLLMGGQSSTTFVERCEFRSSYISVANFPYMKKGLLCSFRVSPTTPLFQMQLWNGGVLQGGELFRFMLVDANYKA